jgi:Leucine-rich repeat (LRR) protein
LSGLLIDNNKLNQFPSQLPPNLVWLNLNQNSITSISSTTLFSLTRLERLNLSENQITILPTQIGLLTSLQELDLSFNKFSFIPSDLVSEQSTQILSLFLKHIYDFSQLLFCFVFVLEFTLKSELVVCVLQQFDIRSNHSSITV